jgi:hypothetical protein
VAATISQSVITCEVGKQERPKESDDVGVYDFGNFYPQWLKEFSADFGIQNAKDLRTKEWKTDSLRTTPENKIINP